MDKLALETTYIPHLRGQFSHGAVVLFLGAGFSLSARNSLGNPVPSAANLTLSLWKLCFPNDEFDPTTQLQDIFDTALSQKPKELGDLLRRSFTVDYESCPKWYQQLLTMPWLRIYTLNIDDLVSKVLSAVHGSRPIRVVSASSQIDPIFDDSKLTVIHLNGALEDVPRGVIFARSQYAQRSGVDPAYTQLRNDLLFRSIVFVGSSMEEGPFWQHLEMRGGAGGRGQRELRPRSYLVVPTLNKSKESLLARFNVTWLPLTAESFAGDVLSRLEDARSVGHSELGRLVGSYSGVDFRIERVADLAGKSQATDEYLLGAEPTWNDVTSGKVAQRACFDELWQLMSAVRAEPNRRRVVMLSGTAGTGKTSALMVAALRLEADGVATGWLDASSVIPRHAFRQALAAQPALGAILINDADIYDARLSLLVRDAVDHNPRLLVLFETRSSKIDRIINRHDLRDIELNDYFVPPLVDSDIDSILDVLDREHRLGRLKGMARDERRKIFRSVAGRQMLVAMHFATHGRNFEDKAKDELREMPAEEQFMYGLICVASAHRYTLRKEDIGIASEDDAWPGTLDALGRRKLVLPAGSDGYRARHRIIAQFVYDSLAEDGKLHAIIRALLRLGATKTTKYTPRESQYARILRTFINHEQMKRGVGIAQARNIYSDFEEALAWDHHYWLHRGALELESDNLDRAENFLSQAKSIEDGDVFVDNELAYLLFKKAIRRPSDAASSAMVDEAIETLNDIALRRPDQIAHCYHIMGQQGLIWAAVGIDTKDKKRSFLEYLLKKAEIAERDQQTEILKDLSNSIRKAILTLAVEKENQTSGSSG